MRGLLFGALISVVAHAHAGSWYYSITPHPLPTNPYMPAKNFVGPQVHKFDVVGVSCEITAELDPKHRNLICDFGAGGKAEVGGICEPGAALRGMYIHRKDRKASVNFSCVEAD